MQQSAVEVERAIVVTNLEAEVPARKGSVFLPWGTITEMVPKLNHRGLPELAFKGAGTKHRFQFEQGRDAEVAAFLATWARN